MKSHILVLSALLIAFAGCLSSGHGSIESVVPVGGMLGIGDSIDGISVEFLRVEEDSRCPEIQECGEAGRAEVILRTTINGDAGHDISLEFINGSVTTHRVDKFTLSLFELTPKSTTKLNLDQLQYGLRLQIVGD